MRVHWLLAVVAFANAQDMPRGQIIASVECAADASQTYALYLPSNYRPDRTWSVILAFDPGARGRVPVERFQAAAEKYGYIVAGSNNSRNGSWKVSTAAAQAMWNDVIHRFAVDDRRIYAAGFSGGARVAMGLAMGTGKLAGVIAASAGFPDATPRKSVPFAVFGTAGTEDFNYLEMRDLERGLTSPHHVEIFEGGHDWSPTEVATEAIEWLEIQAMRSGLRPRDEAMLNKLFQAHRDRIATQPDLLSEVRAVKALVADFQGLRDVSADTARAAQLQREKGFREAAKKERAEEQREELLRNELDQLVAGLAGDAPVHGASLAQLKVRLPALWKQAHAAEDSGERQLARRLLGGILVGSGSVHDAEYQKLLETLRP